VIFERHPPRDDPTVRQFLAFLVLLYDGEQARGQLTGHLIDQRAELLPTLRCMARGFFN
jgi:hypothetical protein